MPFNSYTYLLLFLPLVALGFQLLREGRPRIPTLWLVLVSLVFYDVWNPDPTNTWSPRYLLLILGSCGFNYIVGYTLSRLKQSPSSKSLLTAGIAVNLGLLGYFKYAGFFAGLLTSVTGWPGSSPTIILPLAISFFTFLQIAYLVDAWQGNTAGYRFTDYLLFVTFFPHLIAGPLIHHREMISQFTRKRNRGIRANNFSVGITLLALGLFKKVVLTDYLSRSASPIFDLAATDGRPPASGEAWADALAYTLQLYFDFSGYSDMALGSARIFGIRFPLNFHSPYKASSVIEFWRRCHITLSRFLRDYLYIPLGGNRKGRFRRYINLFLTMLLGGIWHGAGWTFILWGSLHGALLRVNHAWLEIRKRLELPPLAKPIAVGLTFLAVLGGWVIFRSESFPAAARMFATMAGLDGFAGWSPDSIQVVRDTPAIRPIIIGLSICWFLPNTQELMKRYLPALGMLEFPELRPRRYRWSCWRPTLPWAFFTLAVLSGVGRKFDKASEFIYFQF